MNPGRASSIFNIKIVCCNNCLHNLLMWFFCPGETEDIVNGNTASSGTSQVTHVKDSSQMITVNASSSPPNEMKCGSTANK